MARREFSKAVLRAALARADGRCEGLLTDGSRCPCALQVGWFHYDHIAPAALTEDASLENCQVLCRPGYAAKTVVDVGGDEDLLEGALLELVADALRHFGLQGRGELAQHHADGAGAPARGPGAGVWAVPELLDGRRDPLMHHLGDGGSLGCSATTRSTSTASCWRVSH